MKHILRTIISLAILAWILPTVQFSGGVTLVIAAVVLTILNSLVKPILKLLFLPINIITLGFFSFIINILILWLALYLVPGFQVQNTMILEYRLGTVGTLFLISLLLAWIDPVLRIFIK